MITDDPGTPGNGHWENNFALTFERRRNEAAVDFPAVDLNYGLGDHIQLTIQTAPAFRKRRGHGVVGGLGGTEAAVKWRFLDEETNGVDVSMFPRLIFNLTQSSVRRGLAEDGTRFQLPLQMAKKVGPFALDLELGALSGTVGRTEFLYGLAAGRALTKRTTLMAEVHGTSRANFTDDILVVNLGVRYVFNERCVWIASLGHEVRAPDDQPLALVGYCGVQLLY